MEEETAIIMAALSTLAPHQLSELTTTVVSLNHHHHHRLATLLSSHTHFSLTLHHLHSLSLPQKNLLVARHLLSSLHHLTLHFHHTAIPTITTTTTIKAINHRDLDAVLLLLLLCETHQHDPKFLDTPSMEWREALVGLFSDTMLTPQSHVGVYNGGALIPFIETVTRCWKFVAAMGGVGGGGGRGGKDGREVAASPVAVVALPSVEVSGGGGGECVICKEEMSEGRDVCELPCQHLFHWLCILPWLRKRNTCPCCRSRLPTDDVLGEIERLWAVLIKYCRMFNGDSF